MSRTISAHKRPRRDVVPCGFGFSLVELMIVLAIIAVTAAYAVPAYQDYMARSRVGEGLSLAAPFRLAVAENAAFGLPFDSGQGEQGADRRAAVTTSNVSDIAVAPHNGQITIRYSARVAHADANTLVLMPSMDDGSGTRVALRRGVPLSGTLVWECFAVGKGMRQGNDDPSQSDPTARSGPAPTSPATLPARLAMAACR